MGKVLSALNGEKRPGRHSHPLINLDYDKVQDFEVDPT
jgi:hypothetical protein